MEENDEKQDGEIIATSEFDKIVDDASLLKFCQAKNESQTEPTSQSLISLLNHINTRLLQQNIKLSIETCYELLIFCPLAEFYFMGYNHKTFLEQIDFGDNNNEKLNSLEQILNFIKSHKQSNENSEVQNYLRLIYFFLGFPIKTCSVNEFLEVMEFDFADSKIWDDGTISLIIQILSSFIDKDKNQCSDVAKVLNDIFNSEFKHVKCDPGLINFIAELLTKLKKLHMDISIDCTKITNNYFTQLPPEKFDFKNWLVFLSCCKDNSVSQVALDILIKSKQSLLGTVFLPFKYSLREDEISAIKTKYGKCIFTPSLINLIRHKFSFDKNYDLEKVLKDNFGENNFVKGDSCDLSVIMYRLCFECEQCIPHEKQDIIKLFESTKLFSPNTYYGDASYQYSQNIKEKIDVDLQCTSLTCYENKIYAELDDFVQQIFIEKGVVQKGEDNNNKIENEIVNEQSNNSKILTLEELKIIVLSNFEFATEDQPNGITKEKFATLIPDKIYDKYYFKWCLEFYKGKRGISKEDFIFCINRYKFTDINDFNDFCSEISNSYSLYKNARFDLDCVSALLDVCDGIDSLKEESDSFRYMQEIVSETRNQELTDQINRKFNLQLIKKQNEILTTNNNRLIIENPNLNNAQSKSKTIVNPKSNEGKTPLWIIIITLGGIFWGPWLFKKIFGCCYDFEDTVVPTNETDNQKSSNQNQMPNQGNNLEENLNK